MKMPTEVKLVLGLLALIALVYTGKLIDILVASL